MLSRKYRFHSRGGIKYTYKKGKTIRTPKISLVYAPNKFKKHRFAVVVSKKTCKKAVDRNRIRRRVYEAIRAELPNYQPTNDCIFVIFSRDIKTINFKELQSTISSLLEQSML